MRFCGSGGDHFYLGGRHRVSRVNDARIHIPGFHVRQPLAHIFPQNRFGIHRVIDSERGEHFLRILPGRHSHGLAQRDLFHIGARQILERRYSRRGVFRDDENHFVP